jgi:hypothetical protein
MLPEQSDVKSFQGHRGHGRGPCLGPKGKHLLFKKHEGLPKIEPSSVTFFKSFCQLFKIGTVDKKSTCSKKI